MLRKRLKRREAKHNRNAGRRVARELAFELHADDRRKVYPAEHLGAETAPGPERRTEAATEKISAAIHSTGSINLARADEGGRIPSAAETAAIEPGAEIDIHA